MSGISEARPVPATGAQPDNRPRRTIRVALVLLAVLIGLCLLAALYDILFPQSHLIPPTNDFANYWVAARLTLSGDTAKLFSGHDVYFDHLKSIFGADYPWRTWSYPPHYLLLIWPLGFLSFDAAAALFEAASLAMMLWAGYHQRRPVPESTILVLLPFLIVNGLLLQNGLLTAGLMLAGLNLRNRAPLTAGVFFGLMTIKPQLGLLLPLLLLAERNWRAIGSAILTAVLLTALSALLFGVSAWTGYIERTMPYQVIVMNALDGGFLGMMPGLFGTLRNLGLSSDIALRAHIAVAVPVIAIYLYGLFRLKDADDRALLTLIAGFIVSPYALFYDFGALTFIAATRVDFRVIGAHGAKALISAAMLVLVLMPLLSTLAILTGYRLVYLPLLLAGMAACLAGARISRQPPDVCLS